jgi:hypothetical protein
VGRTKEGQYQARLIRKLKEMFPGCLILKNDPQYLQGVPDVLILFYGRWGALEVKLALDGEIQANQSYYIEMMDRMSFASFICPENEDRVLYDLQRTLAPGRKTRVS